MSITVRAAILTDVSEIERIAGQSGLSTWTHQGYLDEIKRTDSIFLIVETDDRSVSGFVVGRVVPGPEAEIYNIAVAKKARRRGLGRELLAEFISRCKAQRVRHIWLEVRHSNVNAISFYKKLGFGEVSVRPQFYSNPVEDAVIMKLEI
jgi:ribosomal-protein-alanine N-acetyltransferase